MANHWNHILTSTEIAAYFDRMEKLDPRMARETREFYESRTMDQLVTLAHGAWNANLSDQYQLARSYAALTKAA